MFDFSTSRFLTGRPIAPRHLQQHGHRLCWNGGHDSPAPARRCTLNLPLPVVSPAQRRPQNLRQLAVCRRREVPPLPSHSSTRQLVTGGIQPGTDPRLPRKLPVAASRQTINEKDRVRLRLFQWHNVVSQTLFLLAKGDLYGGLPGAHDHWIPSRERLPSGAKWQ